MGYFIFHTGNNHLEEEHGMKNDGDNKQRLDTDDSLPDIKEDGMADFSHKWLKGIIVISLVGVLSYTFLFVLMLLM